MHEASFLCESPAIIYCACMCTLLNGSSAWCARNTMPRSTHPWRAGIELVIERDAMVLVSVGSIGSGTTAPTATHQSGSSKIGTNQKKKTERRFVGSGDTPKNAR